jgi:N-acetylglutamate synthase-like GNAT family acetyltransferase
MSAVQLRPAEPADLADMARLLKEADLSAEGVEAHLPNFLVAIRGREVIGTVGIERYGPVGLFRSLAVTRSERSRGIGETLMARALADARTRGITRLLLLTTTADGYFARHGWHRLDRTSVTGDVTGSAQFRGACPASAVCMEVIP